MSTHVASHTRNLPLDQGTIVTPSGRLPSSRNRLDDQIHLQDDRRSCRGVVDKWEHYYYYYYYYYYATCPQALGPNCPASKKKQQSKHHNKHNYIVMSVLSINQFNSNQSGRVLERGVWQIIYIVDCRSMMPPFRCP